MAAEGRTEQQDTDEASVTINGETLYYATLEEAFAAANRQTATITMLTDAECIKSDSAGSPLNITGGNVTLNLNGKTLSGKGYGNYGTIDVSGGSLLVQGEDGKLKVEWRGLSCRGNGKLIVEGITLELVGIDSSFAVSGIHNAGGTVILNGTQMTGAAFDAQIYHYSGTTTVNNVTATGVTENCPKSVWYHNEGTLTINGGTFDKIVVESGNGGGVQSVAELLGEGYTYKKQGGAWATADEMAGLEISNVTVEKIPLTINPNGDTLWYYSTQQTHTLAMNAAPVSGGTVTYVWKNGEETLDCTSDAYTVPAGMPVGSYTYTCEATCDGYTLSHTFTFKIEKSGTEFTGGIKTYNGETETKDFTASDTITVKATPTATGEAPANSAMFAASFTGPGAGQMAVFVGDTQVSAPADKGADGAYTMTVSAADVLVAAGGPGTGITLTAKFVGNDNMADGAGTATVNITAVAKAERGGTVIGYYGESGLNAALADKNNEGAVFTKASSSITTAPSATGITYGQALSDSTLTGGTGSVPGAFAWTDSTAKPNAGTAQFEVTFTPTDTNYNSTTTNVSVTVAKATPTLTAPTATAIQYGQKLTDSALTGGTATNPNGSAAIAGSWHWASGNTQPTATGTFPVSFAPSDTANYNTPANVDTNRIIIPVQAEYLPAKGLEQLLSTVNKVKRQINPKLQIDGILLTMVDNRTNFAKEIAALLRETYGSKIKVFGTEIPHSVRAKETSAEGRSIFAHDPGGKVAEGYANLTKEVLKLEKQREKSRAGIGR